MERSKEKIKIKIDKKTYNQKSYRVWINKIHLLKINRQIKISKIYWLYTLLYFVFFLESTGNFYVWLIFINWFKNIF